MPNKKIIAVDFDGTLSRSEFPECGNKNHELFALLEKYRENTIIILWTCRVGNALKDAVNWCNSHGLHFDYVNEQCQEAIDMFGGDSRKVYADMYIDDRSCLPDTISLLYGTKPIEDLTDYETCKNFQRQSLFTSLGCKRGRELIRIGQAVISDHIDTCDGYESTIPSLEEHADNLLFHLHESGIYEHGTGRSPEGYPAVAKMAMKLDMFISRRKK